MQSKNVRMKVRGRGGRERDRETGGCGDQMVISRSECGWRSQWAVNWQSFQLSQTKVRCAGLKRVRERERRRPKSDRRVGGKARKERRPSIGGD